MYFLQLLHAIDHFADRTLVILRRIKLKKKRKVNKNRLQSFSKLKTII